MKRALLVAWISAWIVACAGSSGPAPDTSPAPPPVPKAAWERPPAQAPDRPVVAEDRLVRRELGNGLRLLILEDHRIPYASFGVTLRRGAASEAPDEAGLAGFTAELMERGAGSRDALELAETMDALGASYGVSSGWDSVTASTSGLSGDRDLLLEVLADLVLRPQLRESEATRVRKETLAALEREKDDPRSLAARAFTRAMYGTHRYGTPVAGTPETVSTFRARDAKKFHRGFFVPGNAIFFASGDVDPDALAAEVEKVFGAWSEAPVPELPEAPAQALPESTRVVIVNRPDLGQAQLRVGHEGIGRTDDRRIAARLMNLPLGGSGFSSRLMGRIRAEEGLTYGVNSYFTLRRAPGPFLVSTFTRFSEARTVIDLILAELERIRTEPPTGAELADAKSLSTGRPPAATWSWTSCPATNWGLEPAWI